ncbi:hypothetical protein BGZ57DRAFT_904923 [Hyaloscypha finlandica]|nr:hypothetical protein BGZ57DRAFT_904923 [Hyaloscypha finlandica]
MFFSTTLVTLLLAGLSQTAPTSSNTTSTVSTSTSSTVLPAQSTTAPQNNTATAKFSASNFTDVKPTINPNITIQSLTKPLTNPELHLIPGWPKIPIHLITCQNLIDAKATLLKVNVGTPASGFISDPSWGTVHKDYAWGSIYCHDVSHGAHAVYGAIWLKWKAQGGSYGYPLTDELGTTDNSGTYIRYNVFSDNRAIYWTGQRGAFLIYGDIYQRWLSIGNTKSEIGYPITDETSSGSAGGRFNDFSNGMIYWHAGQSWVHVGGLPSSLTWTWNPISLTDVSGSSSVTLYSDGNAHWMSSMHDHILVQFNWQIGWLFVNADGTAITLAQSGTVGPNYSGIPIFGGPTNDNNIDRWVNNPEIAYDWRAWVASNYGTGHAHGSIDWGNLLNELINDAKAVYGAVTTIIAVLA